MPEINRLSIVGGQEGDMERLDIANVYNSDGILGPFGQMANLTQGGWGWIAIDEADHFIGGRCGILEGDVQTVPLAE